MVALLLCLGCLGARGATYLAVETDTNGLVVRPTNGVAGASSNMPGPYWFFLQNSNGINSVVRGGTNGGGGGVSVKQGANVVLTTNASEVTINGPATNGFVDHNVTNGLPGFSITNPLGSAAFHAAGEFVLSLNGPATNIALWNKATFNDSGNVHWTADWFDNKFELTNMGLGSVYSFASSGYLTAGGFNGDGGSLTNLNASSLASGLVPPAQAGSISNHSDVAAVAFAGGDVWAYNPTTHKWTNGAPATVTNGRFTNHTDVAGTALSPGDILAYNAAGVWTNGPPQSGTGGSGFVTTNAAFANALLKSDGTSNYWDYPTPWLIPINGNGKDLTNAGKGVFTSTLVALGTIIGGNGNSIQLTNNSPAANSIQFKGGGAGGDGNLGNIIDSTAGLLNTTAQPGLIVYGTNALSANANKMILAAGTLHGIQFGVAPKYPVAYYSANHTNTILDYYVLMSAPTGNTTNFLPPTALDGTTFVCVFDQSDVSGHSVVIHGNGRNINGATSLSTSTPGLGWTVFYANSVWNTLPHLP